MLGFAIPVFTVQVHYSRSNKIRFLLQSAISFSGFMLSFPSFCTILLLYFVVAPKNCWKQLASKGIGDI